MWFGTEGGWAVATFFLVAVIGYFAAKIDLRLRELKLQQQRLSVTYFRFECTLDAIQDSILIMARDGSGGLDKIKTIRGRRTELLRHIVENGPSVADIMRGLEFPNPANDPAFWAEDRLIKLGLETDTQSVPVDDR